MRVGVLGAGTMGSGIAQVCAMGGHEVTLHDVSEEALKRAEKVMGESLDRLAAKGKLSPAAAADAQSRVKPSNELRDLAQSEVIVEAVFESVPVKRQVWQELARVVSSGTLLASNTSSLSITEIAADSGRPEEFCGMHFFNPAPLMPLVEVVRGLSTRDETIERARAFVEGIGKTAIVCGDRPGFIVNRLLVPYINDAIHALSERLASAEDIDMAMKLGANMPMGPLALADLVGLDVTLAAADSLHREFGDPKFRVAPLLRQMVRGGKLGRKSGEGFYRYE